MSRRFRRRGTDGLTRMEYVGEPVAVVFAMSAREFADLVGPDVEWPVDEQGPQRTPVEVVDIEGRVHRLTPWDVGLFDELGEFD